MKIKEKNKSNATEEHGKQFVEPNEIAKKDFNIDTDNIPLEEQKEIFTELVEEKS